MARAAAWELEKEEAQHNKVCWGCSDAGFDGFSIEWLLAWELWWLVLHLLLAPSCGATAWRAACCQPVPHQLTRYTTTAATQARTQRIKWRAEDARMHRHAGILRGFWQTHAGFTRADALVAALFLAGTAGISLTWHSHMVDVRQHQQEQQAQQQQQEQQQTQQQQQQQGQVKQHGMQQRVGRVQAPSLPAAAAVAAVAAASAAETL